MPPGAMRPLQAMPAPPPSSGSQSHPSQAQVCSTHIISFLQCGWGCTHQDWITAGGQCDLFMPPYSSCNNPPCLLFTNAPLNAIWRELIESDFTQLDPIHMNQNTPKPHLTPVGLSLCPKHSTWLAWQTSVEALQRLKPACILNIWPCV